MKKERYDSFDFIKAFAVFSVILLHTAVFSSFEGGGIGQVSLYRIINVSVRFAVPFFFMTSAFLFYDKFMANPNYLWKYFTRIAKISALWYAIYAAYDLIVTKRSWGIVLPYLPPETSLMQRLYNAFSMGVITLSSYHLWYLWATLIVLLLIAVYTKFTYNLWPLLGIALVLNFLGMFGTWQAFNFLIPQESIIKLAFTREAFCFGLLYFTIGMIIASYKDHEIFKGNPMKFFALFILFTVFSIMESQLYTNISEANVLADFYFMTIPVSISLISFALSFKNLGRGSIINLIGQNSLYFYAGHILVLHPSYFYIYSGKIDLASLKFNLLFAPTIMLILMIVILPFTILKKKSKMKAAINN